MASSSNDHSNILASEETLGSEPLKPTGEKRKRKREKKKKEERECSDGEASEDTNEKRRRKRKRKHKDEGALEEGDKERKRERRHKRKGIEKGGKKLEEKQKHKSKDDSGGERKKRKRKRLEKLDESDGKPEPSEIVLGVNNSIPGQDVERTSRQCFRIQNVPQSWDRNDLLDCLRGADKSLENLDVSELSLYPACSGLKQTALLKPEETPEYFRTLAVEDSIWVPVYDKNSRKKVFDLVIDSDFYELTPLNMPRGEIIADVVAVTGLAGHAFGSWRHRKTGSMWLQDFLPEESNCKGFRILIYGYNTKLVGRGTVDDGFLDYRRNFIQQLENARSSEEEKFRPIIFIGHSLGGILILQALVQAKNRPHKHILDSTKAIFFFGTPHAGLQIEELVEMVDDMSGLGEPSSRLKLLELLAENSEFLETLRDGLTDIWDNLKVFSFYENKKTPTVQKKATTGAWKRDGKEVQMVKAFSALLHSRFEIPVPISRNHTELVKFSSGADSDYQTVVTYLSSCAKDIIKFRELERKAKECARTSPIWRPEDYRKIDQWFSNINHTQVIRMTKSNEKFLEGLKAFDCQAHRKQLCAKRNEKTCQWFLEDERYKDWRDGALVLLWVRGCAGCGKSVLSAYLSVELVDSNNGAPPLIAYFFCDDTDERRKTADAILRGLLKHLLYQSPQLFQYVPRGYTEDPEKIKWDFESLWEVFECVIVNGDAGPIVCLVDGLDECEEKTRTIFSERIQSLFAKLPRSGIRFRMIITSRLSISGTRQLIDLKWTELCVNEGSLKNDIKEFFRDDIQKFAETKNYFDNQKHRIQHELEIGGDGTFLWASLVMERLWSSPSSSVSGILGVIALFPPTVSDAYAQILTGIKTSNNESGALRVLQWVLNAKHPLTLTELKIAIAIKPEHTSICDMENDLEHDMEQFLSRTFSFLLTIDEKNRVHLRHQSLKDFLTSEEEMKKFDSGDGFLLDIHSEISPGKANRRIAIDCLSYLSFKEFEDEWGYTSSPSRREKDQDLQERIGLYPFVKYAATQWMNHVEQKDREEVGPISESFWKLAQSCAKLNSSEKIRYISSYYSNPYTKTTPLQASAYHGFSIAMERLLDEGAKIDAEEGIYGTAMLEGIRNSNEAVIQVLLGRDFDFNTPISGKWMYVRFGCALEAAANFSNRRAVEVLLNYRAGSNVNNKTGNMKITEAVLVAAAHNRDSQVMKVLLNTASDIKITEAVLLAAIGNWMGLDIMKVLLNTASDIKITEAILLAAVGNQRGLDIMKVLLNTASDIKITEAILVAAVGNQRGLEVMKVLLNTASDFKITEAVLVAAISNKEGFEFLKLLLSTASDIKVTEAVLLAAVGNQRGLDIMKVLLNTASDIKITEAVLVAAAAAGNWSGLEVMKVLLNTASDFKITEAVLLAAAGGWMGLDIMKVLLNTASDFEITEAVLVAAIRNKEGFEFLKLLLSTASDIKVTEAVLVAAISNKEGFEFLKLLLSTASDIKVTEAVLLAAVGNWMGLDIMKVLLNTASDFEITEAVLVAAISNKEGFEFLKLLLSTASGVKVGENVLVAAAGSEESGHEMIKAVLKATGNIKITEAVLVAAAGNWDSGPEVMKVLLDTASGIKITEAVLVEAAYNQRNCQGVMKALFDSTSDIKITEAVLVAVGRNWNSRGVMKVILNTASNIKVTKSF